MRKNIVMMFAVIGSLFAYQAVHANNNNSYSNNSAIVHEESAQVQTDKIVVNKTVTQTLKELNAFAEVKGPYEDTGACMATALIVGASLKHCYQELCDENDDATFTCYQKDVDYCHNDYFHGKTQIVHTTIKPNSSTFNFELGIIKAGEQTEDLEAILAKGCEQKKQDPVLNLPLDKIPPFDNKTQIPNDTNNQSPITPQTVSASTLQTGTSANDTSSPSSGGGCSLQTLGTANSALNFLWIGIPFMGILRMRFRKN